MVVAVRVDMTIAIAPEAVVASTPAARMVLMVTVTVDVITGMMIVAVIERTTTAAASAAGIVSGASMVQ